MPDSVDIFIDTNCFIHLHDLQNRPWREAFPGVKQINIFVAPRIIEELDRHKASTNQRLRDRSRAALKMIDAAAANADLTLTIRQSSSFEVRIVLDRGGTFDWSAHPNLSAALPDDNLVAAAIKHGNDAIVFSLDSGPRIRAGVAGIQSKKPPDDWLLPAEATDDQRKVTKLERDLALALSTKPDIVAGFQGIDDATTEVPLYIPAPPQFDDSQVDALVAAYLEANPMEQLEEADPWSMIGIHGLGHSASTIAAYENEYQQFVAEVRAYFESLHEKVENQGRAVGVPYFVENRSGVVANGLRIQFKLNGRSSLIANREEAESVIGSIEPPTAPKAYSENLQSLFSIPRYDNIRARRDPIAFYWFERPEIPSWESAKECEEFRAGRTYKDETIVLLPQETPTTLTLSLHVEGTNLPVAIDLTATAVIERRKVSWSDAVALGLLPPQIRRMVEKVIT